MTRLNDSAGEPPPPGRRHLRLSGITKTFRREGGEVVRACDDINLEVDQGEFVVLLGPSGCGKTTLLRIIAGLDFPDRGRVQLAGQIVFDQSQRIAISAEKRGVGMVFQSYGLWPHMTAFQNIAYPLQVRKRPKEEIRERVKGLMKQADIEGLDDQRPGQLSGGQQQRVALARAVVAGRDLVLFDEPLSNVDAKVRTQLRNELKGMQTSVGFTAVYVTHDQEEAMSLATRLIVLDRGRIVHDGTPAEVYNQPANLQVARFVGEADEIAGIVRKTAGKAGSTGRVVVDTGAGVLVATYIPSAAWVEVGAPVTVLSRPASWNLYRDEPRAVADGNPGPEGPSGGTGAIVENGLSKPGAWDSEETNMVEARISDVAFQGERVEITAKAGSVELRVWSSSHHGEYCVGDSVILTSAAHRILAFDPSESH